MDVCVTFEEILLRHFREMTFTGLGQVEGKPENMMTLATAVTRVQA